jgi:hypothetical protein
VEVSENRWGYRMAAARKDGASGADAVVIASAAGTFLAAIAANGAHLAFLILVRPSQGPSLPNVIIRAEGTDQKLTM